jgi:hypothetical protein
MINLQNIQSFTNSLINYTSSGFKNASKELTKNRLDICKSCENFNSSNTTCNICGCFLSIKTIWSTEKCPIDKWLAVEDVIQDTTSNTNIASAISIPTPQELTIQQELPDCGCNKKNV